MRQAYRLMFNLEIPGKFFIKVFNVLILKKGRQPVQFNKMGKMKIYEIDLNIRNIKELIRSEESYL